MFFLTQITVENFLQEDIEDDLDDWYDANVKCLINQHYQLEKILLNYKEELLWHCHLRDAVDNMRNESVEGIMDFKWQQQLSFYHDEENCTCKISECLTINFWDLLQDQLLLL
ncbi:unnamed protein product [Paramecium sonneborni]|uniref:Uncharacterized protein n=1 Tax=Paramecium sonneborni TaxID=65129 RepID=A0A8S1MYF8_9CILI|nr:unnamed protein product [Paramecium sonneborni]